MSKKCAVCGGDRCKPSKCLSVDGWLDDAVEAVLRDRPNISEAELVAAVARHLVDRVRKGRE
jgi:hypothetical protein